MTPRIRMILVVALFGATEIPAAKPPMGKECRTRFAEVSSNYEPFEQRIDALVTAIFQKLGLPPPPLPRSADIEPRYLVDQLEGALSSVDWELKADTAVSDAQKAYLAEREALVEILKVPRSRQASQAISDSLSRISFLKSLSMEAFAAHPRAMQIFSNFAMRHAPEFADSFNLLGVALRSCPPADFPKLTLHLAKVAPLLNDLPSPIASEILREFAQRFISQVMFTPRGLDGKPLPLDWNDADLNSLMNFAEHASSDFRQQLSRSVSHLPTVERTMATQPAMAHAIRVNDHPETRQLLERFVKHKHYRTLSPQAQAEIFFHLAYALKMARNAKTEQHANLLRNTVEVATRDEVRITLEWLAPNLGGYASHDNSVIGLNWRHTVGADNFATSNRVARLVGVLAHEASHILSRRPVSESVDYFEEEMRAWQVGFLAEFGKLPSKAEAAEHAAFLLFFNGETLDSGHPYRAISRAFAQNPVQFKSHLAALGLAVSPQQSAADVRQALIRVSHGVAAPQWGWPGYLTNQSPPAGW